jgi:hypothetical protein
MFGGWTSSAIGLPMISARPSGVLGGAATADSARLAIKTPQTQAVTFARENRRLCWDELNMRGTLEQLQAGGQRRCRQGNKGGNDRCKFK